LLQIGSKIEFDGFCRSNIKNEIWVLKDDPRKPIKYWMATSMCTPTHQNLAQKFRWCAHFSWFSSQFPKISNFCRAINLCGTETISIWKSIYFWQWNILIFQWVFPTKFFFVKKKINSLCSCIKKQTKKKFCRSLIIPCQYSKKTHHFTVKSRCFVFLLFWVKHGTY